MKATRERSVGVILEGMTQRVQRVVKIVRKTGGGTQALPFKIFCRPRNIIKFWLGRLPPTSDLT